MIRAENTGFSYRTEKGAYRALKNVSIEIRPGEAVAVLGRNGSGKSTLARLLNGLLIPDEGRVVVFGRDTSKDDLWEVRKSCGMVFQDPDSQIVAGIVDEDIAFGLENTGLERSEMEKRIDEALSAVGMSEYKLHSTQYLSGGQKQKIAVAGIAAMRPKCIVLDEATSMLDPEGRRSVVSAVKELQKNYGISVVMITHFIEEAAQCGYVYVMDGGEIIMEGSPEDILTRDEELRRCGLEAPLCVRLAEAFGFEKKLYGDDEICALLCERIKNGEGDNLPQKITETVQEEKKKPTGNTGNTGNIIEVRSLSFAYGREKILEDIDFGIKEGSFTSIIGHTGSGKSTLLRLLNGLYKPLDGEVFFKGENIEHIKGIRNKIGIVFQNPDHQLFEETVLKDVMFGGLNMGMSEDEAKKRAEKALLAVGFPPEKNERAPFELSGGEKKRAAIAGILIMEPQVLVLDEPGAGLDPEGKASVLETIKKIQRRGLTVVMVTHNMENAAGLSDHIIILSRGRIYAEGSPAVIFNNAGDLEGIGLEMPAVAKLRQKLGKKGIYVPDSIFSAEKFAEYLKYSGS